jgi:hypothetical protein
MFVPSTPSCSTSPSSPRVCHLSDLTYVFCHSRSSLTASPPPSTLLTFHLPIKSFQTHLSRCHFRLLAFMFHLVPFLPLLLPVSCQNKTWLLGYPGISLTVNKPSTTPLCSFNRHLTQCDTAVRSIPHGALPIFPTPYRVPIERHRSYLGSLIRVSILRHDTQRRCVTGTYFF